jgi:hypothetical protein
MEVCGCLISKPGYSTFAEACRLDLPIISIVREGFAEAPILLAGLRDYARHQVIELADLYAGDWGFLRQPLVEPRLETGLAKDGNGAIGRSVVDFLG